MSGCVQLHLSQLFQLFSNEPLPNKFSNTEISKHNESRQHRRLEEASVEENKHRKNNLYFNREPSMRGRERR